MTLDWFQCNFIEHKSVPLHKMEFQKTFLIQLLMIKIHQDLLLKNRLNFNDQSRGNYDVNKAIRIKTSKLRSNLCDFNDAYIVVKRDITVGAPNNVKINK